MQTIINVDDQLFMHVKLQATKQGCTLKDVMENSPHPKGFLSITH